jgi:fatty-acyl-CoA synthase
MNIPLTPLRCLRHAERQYPNRTAIVCGPRRYSYEQFGERVGLLAGALLEAGIQSGDRVAYLGVNTHRLMEAYYGVLEAGAILLPLNIRLAPAELTYVLNDAGATVLFIEQPFIPLVESFRESLFTVKKFIQLDGVPETGWTARDNYDAMLRKATPHRADITLIDEDEVAEIFYTSGTSARPKGVMLTHRNIYLHALQVCMPSRSRTARQNFTPSLSFTPMAGVWPSSSP